MKKFTVVTVFGIFLILFSSLLADRAAASKEFYLDVPLYCQQTSYWCGAASGQMVMMGYPNPEDRRAVNQTEVWDTIQIFKEESGWYTDPDGLRGAINYLNPPPEPGEYFIDWLPDKYDLMDHTIYYMARYHHPSTTLVYGAAHWIVIMGVTFTVNPGDRSEADLEYIEINNPWPYCTFYDNGNVEGAVNSLMTGSTWFSSYWTNPISFGKWGGGYLNIVKGPESPSLPPGDIPSISRASVEHSFADGNGYTDLNRSDLLDAAAYWLDRIRPHEYPGLEQLIDLTPKAVHPVIATYSGEKYYIVLLTDRKSSANVSMGWMRLNPQGDFIEVGTYHRPLAFPSEEKAIERAYRHLTIDGSKHTVQKDELSGHLVFNPSRESFSPGYPLWCVEGPDIRLYVNLEGEVFEMLTVSAGGGY
jgi:hypothetical protein